MLLLLLGLPLGRSLVTRHSVRPDLAPVLRLKGGATFNQWLRLFRVVVKGAKGGARNAQRVPAARGTASRGAAVEQGAAFSRVLSAPRSTELAVPSRSLATGSLAGGPTLAGAASMAAATAVIVRPPPAAGPTTTSLGSAPSMSTRSLNQPAAASVPGTAAPAPAATTPGVGPARGVDAQLPISLSPPAQRVEPPTGDPNAHPNPDADADADADPDPDQARRTSWGPSCASSGASGPRRRRRSSRRRR